MVKDWETSNLDGKCPNQVSNIYDRPVCFQVRSVCVDGLTGGGVLVLNQDKTASFQDKTATL